ncbi:hypothetical protein Sjap_026068 [Stephania japonica]|uniref:Uncharacterized protein n=1 Tax=Stephania japonica TaxID=461633 RepID=A0AAP0E6B9_9MAGN
MTKVFKRWMIPEGYCWKSVPPHHKDKYWRHWKAPEEMSELTQCYTDQSVDDEAVYLNVAGECPEGRVYGLGSLGRKKRRYARSWCYHVRDAGYGAACEFNVVASNYERLWSSCKKDLGMNMDGAAYLKEQPPPPPPKTATS